MGFFLTDAIGDAIDAAADVVSSVWDRVPGSGWVDDFTGTLTGPLRDFANTAVGQVILRAIATTILGPTALIVGPALATAVFALPGLARGEAFDEAFVKEFGWRLEKLAEYFADEAGSEGAKFISDKVGDDLIRGGEDLIKQAQEAFPSLPVDQAVRELGLTPRELAAKLGIREDVAAFVIAWAARESVDAFKAILSRYDLRTGRYVAPGTSAFRPGAMRTTVEGRAVTARTVGQAFTGVQSAPTTFYSAAYKAPAPIVVASAGGATTTTTTRAKKSGDALLAVVILGAAGALAYWHHKESRR